MKMQKTFVIFFYVQLLRHVMKDKRKRDVIAKCKFNGGEGCLFNDQILDVPVFVAVIGQETSDDQRNFLLSKLLHGDDQRVWFTVKFDHDGGIKTIGQKLVSIRARHLETTVCCRHIPDLQCSRSKHSCSLILGHIWCSDSLLWFCQFSGLITSHKVI